MSTLFKAIPQSTLRQWRNTPTYIFLVWRWGTWLFALIWYLALPDYPSPHVVNVLRICLTLTFFYTLIVTLYAPVSRIFLARLSRSPYKAGVSDEQKRSKSSRQVRQNISSSDQEARIIDPLARTQNKYWNISIYILDVLICGLITYFSAVNSAPPYGIGSPFYRYGLSAVLVAGFAYSYRGGLLATLLYSVCSIMGVIIHPPGQTNIYPINALDIAGSLIDAPLVAMMAAYLANQLNKAIMSKRREQDHARREAALRGVSQMLITEMTDQVQLLQNSLVAIRRGGHFDKLVIALVRQKDGEEPRPDFDTYVETDIADEERPDVSEELIMLVTKTRHRHLSFDPLSDSSGKGHYGIARLYQPFFKDQHIYLVIGAESMRQTPFEPRHEEFLAIVGPQLIVALENIRLTGETAVLATLAERGRIARDIHDGIAQMLYMLSLNSETCVTLVERASNTSEEAQQALLPVTQNLERLVTISKQALWETRHYMFMLRPLIGTEMTLEQMLHGQIQEFQAISGLVAHLEVSGEPAKGNGNQARNQRLDQVNTALFRITQEALTNAYKHAEATHILVSLRYQPDAILLEIRDDGKGIMTSGYAPGTEKLYSGRGLQGMRERASELGGTLDVCPGSSGGTCIVARLPL